MKRSTTILLCMVAAAAIALAFGFFIVKKRINTPPTQNNTNSDQTQNPSPSPDQTTNIPISSTSGWKTYTNDKHGFTIMYPTTLKAGSVSDNSVLGTYQVPVRGIHVGPLVLIALEDKSLAKDAADYFNGMYDAAKNPAPAQGSETPPVVCKIDNVTNSSIVSIKSVSCNGEGGAARYAYLTGKTYDVFVDGYSKGFDSQDNGVISSDSDYATLLSTFVFTKDVAATTPPTTPPGSPTPSTTPPTTPGPNPSQSIQNFTISADDSSATPSSISVTSGNIIEITFNVSADNVYHGGLDFRSSVVNSGTIYSGQSKTISFTANKSFEFTPYWPASQVAKPYKISVVVQ